MQPGETLKWCSSCEQEKPPTEFYKNRSRPDGLQNYCKLCSTAAYRKSLEKHRPARTESRKKFDRNRNLKRLYGITLEEYELMLFDQNGRCALCFESLNEKVAHVDHDHDTGVIRAILCGTCNSGLGMFHHSTEKLLRAISYLDSYKSVESLVSKS